jgi:HlyD family secretion protein
MKTRKYFAGLIVLAAAVAATFVFLIIKAAGPKTEYPTTVVERRTIEEKVLASGSILPLRAVEVKSSLSGVVGALFVDAGEKVRRGDPLMSIAVKASSLDLNSAEAALEKASIRLRDAESETEKAKTLFEKELIAEMEYRKTESAYRLALEDYKEARNRIMLIKEGAADGRNMNNVVFAPIVGTVLEVPVKQGSPVQESGGYAVGTTVAVIADMNSLIFEGDIDEAQIDSLKKGMEAKIKLAAIDNALIPGTLTFISPSGKESSGAIKFKIRITFRAPERLNLRAGYSASAEIILNKTENAVCVQERDLLMEKGRYFVEVEKGTQQFVKTEVRVGISDGLRSEITSGVSEGDRIKSQHALMVR